jgi:hypothetical protein
MREEPTITCPHCQQTIKLTESLAAPLLEANRESYERRLESERKAIALEEAQRAKTRVEEDLAARSREIGELEERLREQGTKLSEAQKAQAEILRERRKLDDRSRELDLTIERKVAEELAAAREGVRLEVGEESKLRLAERDKTIDALKTQIGELQRRAEQGSQQLQGEVLELELETTLAARFPQDAIQPVPKGEFGGDILHRVHGADGRACGTILWETKRTKHWSDTWLLKLRGDQRAAKAEVAVLVSAVLPRGVESFDFVDQVWVVHPKLAIPVAMLLRSTLTELASTRLSNEGLQTKTELVYQYLTGPRFRLRMEGLVEAFIGMEVDLKAEKRAMQRVWAKRECQLEQVMLAAGGMYGDLQGIAGRTLPEIEGLALPGPEEGVLL